MTRAVNLRAEQYDVYIGRQMRGKRDNGFGNPFVIGPDGTRDEVLVKYRAWLRQHPELIKRTRKELKGKRLGCWCKPAACHGDVLAEIAEGAEP